MLACGSLRAAGLSQFLYLQFAFLPTTVAKANNPTHETKTPPAPCVYNIGRNRLRTSCSVASTLSSTRGRLASTVSAIRYATLHSLQPLFPPHSSRLYNLLWLFFPTPQLEGKDLQLKKESTG